MITVFTPTFNRAHTIHRVRESLKSQTYLDFEWVVVDDGSSVDIESTIAGYIAETSFPIRFDRLARNQGKHIATNRALELAGGEFFVVADSDDGFTPDALKLFVDG